MTETGMSLGTPHYMTPEQAMGEREITARSDVYALGAMTYEMLVGEPPFTGPTAQAIVAQVLTEEPRPPVGGAAIRPPRSRTRSLPALDKLPADRFGVGPRVCGGAGRSPRRASSLGQTSLSSRRAAGFMAYPAAAGCPERLADRRGVSPRGPPLLMLSAPGSPSARPPK